MIYFTWDYWVSERVYFRNWVCFCTPVKQWGDTHCVDSIEKSRSSIMMVIPSLIKIHYLLCKVFYLFNNIVSSSECTLLNYRMIKWIMNYKRCGRKQSWPNSGGQCPKVWHEAKHHIKPQSGQWISLLEFEPSNVEEYCPLHWDDQFKKVSVRGWDKHELSLPVNENRSKCKEDMIMGWKFWCFVW